MKIDDLSVVVYLYSLRTFFLFWGGVRGDILSKHCIGFSSNLTGYLFLIESQLKHDNNTIRL